MGLDHYSLSRSADGTPYSSSDLLYFTLLLPFLLGQINSSPTHFPSFAFLDKKFLSPITLLLLFGQKYSKSNFNFAKIFRDNSNFCSHLAKIFQVQFSSWLRKIPWFLLTHSILLPPESKRCPLKLALVLTCRFSGWNSVLKQKWILIRTPFYSILLPLESKQCPLTLASILACADSTDELRFWSMSVS